MRPLAFVAILAAFLSAGASETAAQRASDLEAQHEDPTRPVVFVNVTNLPDVQPVAGTVNVGNLPSIQPVSGSVSIGNLPLAPDGSLLVSGSQTGPSPQIVMYELMPYYTPGSNFVALPEGVSTTGYSAIGLYVGVTPGSQIAVQLLWRMTSDDDFQETHGILPGLTGMNDCGTYGTISSGIRNICLNYGGRPGVVLHQGGTDRATSIRLYLIP